MDCSFENFTILELICGYIGAIGTLTFGSYLGCILYFKTHKRGD